METARLVSWLLEVRRMNGDVTGVQLYGLSKSCDRSMALTPQTSGSQMGVHEGPLGVGEGPLGVREGPLVGR